MKFFTKIKCISKLDYFLLLSTVLFFNIVDGSRFSDPKSYPNYKEFMERMDIDGIANEEECSTPGCNSAAQLIRSNVDEDADPCQNFFDFGCGGFVKRAPRLTPSRPMIGHLEGIQEKVLEELVKTFREPRKPEDPRIFTLVNNYFAACVNMNAINKVGIQPLLRIIDEIGGWPILKGSAWNEKKFNWMEADSILRAYGFPPNRIVKLFVFNDVYNSTKNLLHIEPADLDIHSAILKRSLHSMYDSSVQQYLDYMVNIAVAFGADKKVAKDQLTEVLRFEQQLYAAAVGGPSGSDDEIQVTLNELHLKLRNVPWLKYLNGLTEPITSLQRGDEVIVTNSGYLRKLDTYLPTVSKTVFANYMVWKIIAESIPFLGTKFQNLGSHYRRSKADRSRECVLLLTDEHQGLTVGVSAIYTRKYFSKEARIDIKDIVHAISDEFKAFILKVSWLDDVAKIKAIRKSLYMKQIVGYPNELEDDKLIDNYSRSLVIEPDQHFQNMLNVRRFHYDDSIASLREPGDKRTWITLSDATTINAFYYSITNSFVLLAAILQYPVYDARWPASVKFGSVGFITGHETMHAFDLGGMLFDEHGSFRSNFSKDVESAYTRRVNCYVEQYGKYHDDSLNLNVNGMLTVNENLADNVGMYVARSAYKKWTKEHPDEQKLPGLVYTPDQLFWMSTLNIMCSKESDEILMNTMLTDEHTPDKFRALGALSNMDEFAEDFNCPRRSPMNPKKKCSLL